MCIQFYIFFNATSKVHKDYVRQSVCHEAQLQIHSVIRVFSWHSLVWVFPRSRRLELYFLGNYWWIVHFTFQFSVGASVTISKDTYGKDSYVNRIRYSDPDGGTGNDFIKYTVEDTSKFIAWDYSTRTDKLFYLNTGT